jgi:hypothetical protein
LWFRLQCKINLRYKNLRNELNPYLHLLLHLFLLLPLLLLRLPPWLLPRLPPLLTWQLRRRKLYRKYLPH